MHAFTLDPDNGIPVKLQLKAHVRYQILAGLLRPGDQLPPLRDLAAGLSINLNTVVRAVAELEEEGYIYSHQGKGVFVADEFPGQGHGAALRSLLAGLLGPAREWGMTPEEMAMAMLAHGQLARPPQAAPHRLLLVGGSRPQLRRLQGELEAALPVVVEPALADEVPERLRTGDFRVAVATLFHAAEVKILLPRAAVFTLAGQAAQETFAELQQAEPGTPVMVAARDWVHAARVRRVLERYPLQVGIAVGQTPAALAAGLEEARFVLATHDCRELVREALSGRQGVTTLTESFEIPGEVLTGIRRALGAPLPEQRVQVRSAWV